MTYLEYFLSIRAAVLWEGRNLPSVCACLHQPEARAHVYPSVPWSNRHPNDLSLHLYSHQLDDIVRSCNSLCS